MVCPSFYGYTDAPSSSSNGTAGEGSGDADGDVAMNGSGNGDAEASSKAKGKRKYYVGDDGVTVWRPDMQVDTFMEEGVGKLSSRLCRRS